MLARTIIPVAALSFGAWWLLAPHSVIRFYTWYWRGKGVFPRPMAVRIFGAVWILLMVIAKLTSHD